MKKKQKKNANCDETQKTQILKKFKTQIVMKLKNTYCDEI